MAYEYTTLKYHSNKDIETQEEEKSVPSSNTILYIPA